MAKNCLLDRIRRLLSLRIPLFRFSFVILSHEPHFYWLPTKIYLSCTYIQASPLVTRSIGQQLYALYMYTSGTRWKLQRLGRTSQGKYLAL